MTGWEQIMVGTERGTFEIFVKGEGDPVCVTHHYSEYNESGDYFADVFTERNKVFLVNLKGAGNTDAEREPHELSLVDAIYDLEAIRNKLGFPMWIFAGHSTGGMIGVLYGIHFSPSLKKLILVGTAAREYTTSSSSCIYHKEHPSFEQMQELIERLKQDDLTGKERKRLSRERMQLSLCRPEKFEEYFSKRIVKTMSARRLNFFAREQLIFDVTRQLGNITVKTLTLCGRHDVQCPVQFSLEMHNLIPDSELYIFEESNHYPFLEQPEEFKKVIFNRI